jgi:hypothetical protein
MYIIGLTGFAGSGKDTVAEMLLDQYTGYSRAFADPLRRAASEIFGLTMEQMTDRALKETPVEQWNKTPREILQLMGTECMRNTFGPDVWVKRAEKELLILRELANKEPTEPDLLIWTDVRFAEEADWINKHGGVIVQVNRKDVGPVNDHVSDHGLESYFIDFFLPNNGNLKQLREKVNRYSKDWMLECNQSYYATERAAQCLSR